MVLINIITSSSFIGIVTTNQDSATSVILHPQITVRTLFSMLGPTQDMTPDTNFISQGLLQLISHTLKKQNPKIQQQEILKINDYCSRILSRF
jgi:hypothetical protein